MMRKAVVFIAVVSVSACAPDERGPGRDAGETDVGADSRLDTATPGVDVGRPRDIGPRPNECGSVPGSDVDGDGFLNPEDCNDCSPQINPGAFDAPGNGKDEDCSGVPDDVSDCDMGLSIDGDASDAARAIGLCQFVTAEERGWGVLSARFVRADGMSGETPVSVQSGVLPRLGAAEPRQGAALLALSSGTARAPDQPGYTDDCDSFVPGDGFNDEPFPPTFPVVSPSCPGMDLSDGIVGDSSALEVQIRVPTNAHGFHFASNFYTYEYPNFICDSFNDFYAVLRQHPDGEWENIIFDTDDNPVSVNNSFFRVCTPGTHNGKTFECSLGRGLLSGTGFEGGEACGRDYPIQPAGGATGWLETTAPATGGEVMILRFAIWDSADSNLDSTVLIDAFRWEFDEIEFEEPITSPLI